MQTRAARKALELKINDIGVQKYIESIEEPLTTQIKELQADIRELDSELEMANFHAYELGDEIDSLQFICTAEAIALFLGVITFIVNNVYIGGSLFRY